MGVELARDTAHGGRVHRILDSYKNTLTIVLIGGELEDALDDLRRDPPQPVPRHPHDLEAPYPKIEIVRYPAGWPWCEDQHWWGRPGDPPYCQSAPQQRVPPWSCSSENSHHRPLVGWMVLLEFRDRCHVFPMSEGDTDDLERHRRGRGPRYPRHWYGPFDTFEEARVLADVQAAFPFWLQKAEKMRAAERFVPGFEENAYLGDIDMSPEDLLIGLNHANTEAQLTLVLGNRLLPLCLLEDPETWKKPVEDARGRLQNARRGW